MRVILKPAGLICLLGAFGVLTAAALWRYNSTHQASAVAGASGAASNPAASAAAASAAAAAGAPPPNAPTARPSAAPSKIPLPPGVILAPDIASDDWKSLTSAGQTTLTMVDATVPGHPRARNIKIVELGKDPWDIQLAHTLDAPFKKGKRLELTYWARSENSGRVMAVVEQSAAPYTKITTKEETLTPDWKKYKVEWKQDSDTASGWAKVDFQVGYSIGQVELTGVSLRLAN